VWQEHPTLGRLADVGVLNITSAIHGFEVSAVNSIESDALLEPYASQDVFVVGFPAIDPTFNPEDLPKMLIDTATREGMSGSVVLARHRIFGGKYPRKGGRILWSGGYEELDLVIGIYSGRHYPDLDKAQLGIVWKRSAIEDTVGAGRPVLL
jgi:hypothetical protein